MPDSDPTTHTLDVPGARLYYEQRGAGPLLLMIGSPMDSTGFTGLASALAGDYTVVTYDPRGIGGSSREDTTQDVTPEQQADDVRRLLSALGGDPKSGPPSITGAQLIQPDLASGAKSGYIFTSWGHNVARSSSVASRAVRFSTSSLIWTDTFGSALRLRYHNGFRSEPPLEATTMTRSPSRMKSNGLTRGWPVLRPVVVNSATGAFLDVPPRLPPETL